MNEIAVRLADMLLQAALVLIVAVAILGIVSEILWRADHRG